MLYIDPSGHKACIEIDSHGRCVVQESPNGDGDVVIIDYDPPPRTHDTASDVCENWNIDICTDTSENLPSDRTVDAIVEIAVEYLEKDAYKYQIDYEALRNNVTALLIAAYNYGLRPEEIAYLMATALGESRFGAISAGHNADSMRENIDPLTAKQWYWDDKDRRNGLGNWKVGHAFLYRGRGFIQLTGWTNYNKMDKRYHWAQGMDILNNPDVVADDIHLAADIAAWGWRPAHFQDIHLTTPGRMIVKMEIST